MSRTYSAQQRKVAEQKQSQANAPPSQPNRNEASTPQPAVSENKAYAASTREEDKILEVEITQVLPNGVLAYGAVTHKAFSGGGSTGHPTSGAYYDVPGPGKPIFVQGFTDGVAEGERFYVQAYADGTYTYQDTRGASRTLEKWVFTKVIKRLE